MHLSLIMVVLTKYKNQECHLIDHVKYLVITTATLSSSSTPSFSLASSSSSSCFESDLKIFKLSSLSLSSFYLLSDPRLHRLQRLKTFDLVM